MTLVTQMAIGCHITSAEISNGRPAPRLGACLGRGTMARSYSQKRLGTSIRVQAVPSLLDSAVGGAQTTLGAASMVLQQMTVRTAHERALGTHPLARALRESPPPGDSTVTVRVCSLLS